MFMQTLHELQSGPHVCITPKVDDIRGITRGRALLEILTGGNMGIDGEEQE